MNKEYKFSSSEIESQICHLSEKGITEFSIHDDDISKDKKRIIKILKLIKEFAPEVFISIYVQASVIDRETASAAQQVFCSFDIPLECSEKGGKLLFDKKYYASKARILNDFGLVFGFTLTYATVSGDTLKAFMDRIDFAVQQYPNHIYFPQTEVDLSDSQNAAFSPKTTGSFSANDIRYSRDVSFACRTFYTNGRAVPWFISVLRPLRLYPSKFFADFSEWQRCNNCDFKSGFVPENENHKNLEKMQLLFIEQKYEEKNQHPLIPAVHDIIKINGAMARLAGENEETVITTSFNPDDLLSEEALDLISFTENVCMETCKVKIFAGEEGPDYCLE